MVRLSQLEYTSRRIAPPQNSPEDSPETCRQRRRRRMEMRRSRSNWPPARPPPPRRRLAEGEDDVAPEATLPRRWRLFRSPMPSFSEISIKGFAERSHVNGAVVVQEDFCPPEVFSGGEALHFFAVYDGHASAVYKHLMHGFVAEELTRMDHAAASDGGSGTSDDAPARPRSNRQWWNDHLLSALQRSFDRILSRVDVGSAAAAAAAVAILTAEHIIVARCGGASRVVLFSDGVPIPLCHDRQRQNNNNNKSKGPSEQLRENIELGREVDHSENRGNQRTTRTTTSEPEIFMIERSRDEDECMIVASDSVWDVMSDDVACDVANKCLRDHSFGFGSTSEPAHDYDHQIDHHSGVFPSTTGIDAATLLCRLAIGRGSSDGISVVVVDLKRHSL